MKRFTLFLLFCLLLLTAIPSFAADSDFVIDENGVLTAYNGSAERVVIPAGVKGIGSNVFQGNSTVKEVVIPDSVLSIGDYAFYECSSLTSINIPTSVTSLGDYSFYGCSSLTGITIPSNVASVGSHAFQDCSGLGNITISAGVTSIGDWAFAGCNHWRLQRITIPASVNSLGTDVFNGCTSLQSVSIYSSLTSIPDGMFNECYDLTNFIIPTTVTSIGDRAFRRCTSLSYIKIPEGVTNIGANAFYYCEELNSIVLPVSLRAIGDYAFYDCDALQSITFPTGLTSIGNYAFYRCTGLTSVTLPSGLKSIGTGVFEYCSGLTSIILPDGLTTIGSYAFSGCNSLTNVTLPAGLTSIEKRAFEDCSSLTNITLPDGLTTIGSYAFSECTNLSEITIPNSMRILYGYVFDKCYGLKRITIPSSVTTIQSNTIPDSAFENAPNWYSVQDQTWYSPNQIRNRTRIADTYLAKLDIPETTLTPTVTITPISTSMLTPTSIVTNTPSPTIINTTTSTPTLSEGTCGTNVKYTINGNIINFSKVDSSIDAFWDNCGSVFKESSTITIVNVNETITLPTYSSKLFSGYVYVKEMNLSKFDTSNVTDMGGMFWQCSSLTNLDVSGWDTSNVSDMYLMFTGCTSLKSLDVSGWNTSNVTSMSWMFSGCTSLTSLAVSGWNTSNVTSMSWMFTGCTSLKSLDVSGWNTSNVTSMCNMFENCSSLASLDVSGWDTSNVTDMRGMFTGCSSVISLDVSDWNTSNVTDMGIMFWQCSSLTSLDVSRWNTSNVTSMSGLFGCCTFLTRLDLSDWYTSNVTDMGEMFWQCTSLTNLDLSNWNTSNVTDMAGMFWQCTSMTSLDLSVWNTSNVTDMSYMFCKCTSLTSLDLSGWDTSNVTDMRYMFENCSLLNTITLGKKSVSKNIYESLPAYNDTWYYLSSKEANDPLPTGSSLKGSILFGTYNSDRMAGTWSVNEISSTTPTPTPTYEPIIRVARECTNIITEGIEYYISASRITGFERNSILQDLKLSAVLESDRNTSAGTILGMDIETSAGIRYACTVNEASETNGTSVSCGFVPATGNISGIYISYAPNTNVSEGTPVYIIIDRQNTDSDIVAWAFRTVVQNPVIPCGRNLNEKSLETADGETAVLYVNQDCNQNNSKDQQLTFYEQGSYKDKFAMVSIIPGDYLHGERFNLQVSPNMTFDFKLKLTFAYGYNEASDTYGNYANLYYSYDPSRTPQGQIDDYSELSAAGLNNNNLPLVLYSATLYDVNALGRVSSGMELPTEANMSIKFWYENGTGTLGYENAYYHFTRSLNFKISDSCTATPTPTATPEVPEEVDRFSIWTVDQNGKYQDVTGQTILLDFISRDPLQLIALSPDDPNPPLTWKSSSSSIAAVDSDGVVTGLKTGTATITATNTQTRKSVTVKIKVIAAAQPGSLEISGPSEVAERKTIKLTSVFNQDPQPTNRNVVWSSSDPSTASVNSSGTVTGVSYGSAIISVCAKENESICDSMEISVFPMAASVAIIDEEDGSLMIDLASGNPGYQLGAEVLPAEAGQSVTWRSSSASIAAVDEDGLVTGLRAGTATITATTADGSRKSASVRISVGNKVQPGSLDISGPTEVAERKTIKLTSVFNQDPQPTNQKLLWISSKPDIAKVNSSGVVTGVSGGDAEIIVCSQENLMICDSHQITVLPIAASVAIIDEEDGSMMIDLAGGKTTYQLGVIIDPYDASQAVNWKSSSPSIAQVDGNGLVTAAGKTGTVTITATAADGSNKSASVRISVKAMVQPGSVHISGGNSVAVRKTLQLRAAFEQDVQPTVKTIVWSSSNASIARVSSSGLVTGVSDGIAIIRAEAKDDLSVYDELLITVGEVIAAENGTAALFLSDAAVSEEITNMKQSENTLSLGSAGTAEEIVPEEAAEISGPQFAEKEIWLKVGESVILDVLNPDNEGIFVGLSGDTDAVLWNDSLYMVTSIGEAEVSAILSTTDPFEVRDMADIHIVSELPEHLTEEAAENSALPAEEMASSPEKDTESEIVETTVPEGISDEEMVPDIVPTNAAMDGDEADAAAERSSDDENEVPMEQTEAEGEEPEDTAAEEPASDEQPRSEDNSEESSEGAGESELSDNAENSADILMGHLAESSEKPEIRIRDLGEYDALEGTVTSLLTIERERFELDDEVLEGLIFEIENEAVARLTDRSVEEMLLYGIEIQLLNVGETKLLIKQEDETEPLREIRLVVKAAPLSDTAEPMPVVTDEPAAEVTEETAGDSADENTADLLPAEENFAAAAEEASSEPTVVPTAEPIVGTTEETVPEPAAEPASEAVDDPAVVLIDDTAGIAAEDSAAEAAADLFPALDPEGKPADPVE